MAQMAELSINSPSHNEINRRSLMPWTEAPQVTRVLDLTCRRFPPSYPSSCPFCRFYLAFSRLYCRWLDQHILNLLPEANCLCQYSLFMANKQLVFTETVNKLLSTVLPEIHSRGEMSVLHKHYWSVLPFNSTDVHYGHHWPQSQLSCHQHSSWGAKRTTTLNNIRNTMDKKFVQSIEEENSIVFSYWFILFLPPTKALYTHRGFIKRLIVKLEPFISYYR